MTNYYMICGGVHNRPNLDTGYIIQPDNGTGIMVWISDDGKWPTTVSTGKCTIENKYLVFTQEDGGKLQYYNWYDKADAKTVLTALEII